MKVITSASGAYWKTDGTLNDASSGSAERDGQRRTETQKWDGFGGAFNELGWSFLTSSDACRTQP